MSTRQLLPPLPFSQQRTLFQSRRQFALVALIVLCGMIAGPFVEAGHGVLLQGNGRLVELDDTGTIVWEMPWKGIHDLHLLPSGNVMVQQGASKVVEIDRQNKRVVWTYDAATANGNPGKRVEVHAFQPLDDGRIMIAETTSLRIIEIDRDGKLLKSIPLTVKHPHPHTDTRLVRKIANGNYLACHEADGVIREYDGNSGTIVWEYEVPLFGRAPAPGHGPDSYGNKAFAALRLTNGNTLIATGNGHRVLEVTPEKQVVWQLDQNELPGITLGWVTTLEVLKNGNYIIGNCHAGPQNPILIEIDPKTKKVVWTLDRHQDFGNDVSNSQILPTHVSALR